ncbi:putative virion structural protein [Erwinia phage vB_EamM_Caitlin]|uniref:putative virion structural protein n=1 Tax=Erwinia phage vB_EamM_Caitlin TaxID=1883379 RepID=UPI00081C6D3B|nr:putative virion structural protein [Erwinia phage vB_EamM_Caitlin]ANZ48457.1 putative virion structural protein [Erwinia phage vB_EamM_Caitlin]
MGITISWDDQTDQALDAIEVYRSTSPIDINNPGTPLVSLPGDARSYEDNAVKVGNTYYYCVTVKKGENRSFGAVQTQGYYSNLGPGPQKLLRGDWVRGFFGEMSPIDWVTPADVANKIKAALKSTTGISFTTTTGSTWYKFVYKGKILFIPNVNLLTSNWQNGYNAGFIYGTDDFGDSPTGAPGAVNQRCVIEIGGVQFLARSIRLSDKPVTEYLTDPLDFNDSEWKSTYARLRADGNAITDTAIQPRFNDLSSLNGTSSPHMADVNNVASVNASAPEVLAKTAKTSSTNWMVVLELLQ